MATTGRPIPCYEELPALADTGDRTAATVFGDHVDRGTLNFVTDAARATALSTQRSGHVIPLGVAPDAISPALLPERADLHHRRITDRSGRDDHLTDFWLQSGTHWDGLAHVRYGRHGYFGGFDDDALDAGRLGMDRLAERGIVGRAVLVDLVGDGPGPDPRVRQAIDVEQLATTLSTQGTELEPGDVLLVRTGWLDWYLSLDPAGRAALGGALTSAAAPLSCPGLAASQDMAAWLWDHRVAAVAADNPAVEALPVRREEGFLHRRVVAGLGMPFGELWQLSELAAWCRSAGRWDVLLVSVPIPLPRAAGSPANAVAIV